MSEYYAEHESIEELGNRVANTSSELDEGAATIYASAQRIARSQTLESLGYSNLTRRTQTSVSKLSGKVKDISAILGTVSALYADYEGRVIAALDESVSEGNNYSRESRHETRDQNERYRMYIITITDDGTSDASGGTLIDYSNPTPEQKRQYTLNWLAQNRPDVLEQIYDRLHGISGAATTAGLTGGVASVIGVATSGTAAAATTASTQAATGAQQSGVAQGTTAQTSQWAQSGTGDTTGQAAGNQAAGGASGAGAGMGSGGGSDWVADMLNDAVDSTPVQEAQQAVSNAADVGNPVAVSNGAASLSDSSSMGFATETPSAFAQFLSRMGAGLVDAVQKYGVGAGILAGGAGAVYASSAVTIEAVAHCAEFVATKCMPGVQGLMAQASSAVRVTAISIRATISNAVQGIGGLLG